MVFIDDLLGFPSIGLDANNNNGPAAFDYLPDIGYGSLNYDLDKKDTSVLYGLTPDTNC